MSRYLLQSRERRTVNTDPQRRCYNGCNFSEAEVWDEWSTLYGLPTAEEAEASKARWQKLAKDSGRKLEYRIVPEEQENHHAETK